MSPMMEIVRKVVQLLVSDDIWCFYVLYQMQIAVNEIFEILCEYKFMYIYKKLNYKLEISLNLNF